ncbi:MAG: S-layer homology domain-containing protein [Clostridia bacterium]|nr:S-layer homology domain-containing protein [Clostridia bacterium]
MIKKFALILVLSLMVCTFAYADGTDTAVDNYFENKNTFVDLEGYSWAEPAIYYLAEFGLVEAENGKVYPQKYITRAEFTKLIIGAFGLYDYDARCSFSDVPKTSEYYPYIATAYELGVINGVGNGRFGMDEYLMREDMATIIYRTVQKYGTPLTEYPPLDFVDKDDFFEYSKEPVSALVGAKAVSGNQDYMFLPKNKANFAEACKILYYIMIKNT